MQRTLVLALAGATVALAGGLAALGQGGWAALVLVAVPALHAAALGIEFLWMRRVNARDPAGAPKWAALVGAWLGECVRALQVFGLWQPFLSHAVPDHLPTAARGRRGVILVHGFVCNRGLWRRWSQRLTRLDVPWIAVDLEPVFGPIEGYAPIVESAVQRMWQATGVAPVVVAHSMGGLAVRHWWCTGGDASRLHRLLTLGSPHHGTCLARFALAPNARQMRRGSTWLPALAAAESAAQRRRTTCFFSHCDNIVFPAGSATLAGADNRAVHGVAHVAMAFRPQPWDELLRQLADPADAPDRPATPPA